MQRNKAVQLLLKRADDVGDVLPRLIVVRFQINHSLLQIPEYQEAHKSNPNYVQISKLPDFQIGVGAKVSRELLNEGEQNWLLQRGSALAEQLLGIDPFAQLDDKLQV
jgi:hypothetical protein